jgi:hypothetical protein
MNTSVTTDRILTDRRSTRRRMPKRRERRVATPRFEMPDPQEEAESHGGGTLARTKRLIMAALRVWELKRGIRD